MKTDINKANGGFISQVLHQVCNSLDPPLSSQVTLLAPLLTQHLPQLSLCCFSLWTKQDQNFRGSESWVLRLHSHWCRAPVPWAGYRTLHPQGSISPEHSMTVMLWNCVFSLLCNLIAEHPFSCLRFVCDFCHLVTQRFSHTAHKVRNAATLGLSWKAALGGNLLTQSSTR